MVSPWPPPPGLSWVSAITIGFDAPRAMRDRLGHALGRRGDAAGEIGLMRIHQALSAGHRGIGRAWVSA